MNMCLLEVDMCEKYRSSHFQLEGGVNTLRTRGEGKLKIFGTGVVTFAVNKTEEFCMYLFLIIQ